MRDKRFALVMTAGEYDAMAQQAETLGVSMATAVRLALREWTQQNASSRETAPSGQQALQTIHPVQAS